MADDPLAPAYALQAAQEALAAALLADGAVPFSHADRLGSDLEVGQIVVDRVTGQIAEVAHVARTAGPPAR